MKIRDLQIDQVLQRLHVERDPAKLHRIAYCCEVRYWVAILDRLDRVARQWWDAALEAYRRAE